LLDKSQLYEYNNIASLKYAQLILPYLKTDKTEKDKKNITKEGISQFQRKIDNAWDNAKEHATSQMRRQIK